MNKITKKLFILTMMVFVSLFVVSCGNNGTTTEAITTEDIINHTFDMDTVYYQGNGYEVTFGDLYNSILVNDGIDQLVEMVDRQLLADYLLLVTPEDIESQRTELIYGTTDQETIDDLDEDQVIRLQNSYDNGMSILGFGDDDTTYLQLLVARDLYVEDAMTDPANADELFYIDAIDVADQYRTDKLGDVQSMIIRFDTQGEVTDLLKSYNLVALDQQLKLYTGTTPLDQVPSYNLNDDNTRELTEQELIEYFILFYNDVYENQKTAISETADLAELLTLEDLTFDYETLTDTSSALSGLVFDTLSTMSEGEGTYYTYNPFKISVSTSDNDYYLVLNLKSNHLDLTDFEGDEADLVALIGQDLYDDIFESIKEDNLADSSFVTRRLKAYREDNGFEILDYYLSIDYNNVAPTDLEVTNYRKSDFVIATFDGEDILVKDLLAFALDRKAPLYLIHASQLDILRNLYYNDVYCDDDGNCELDWTQNNSGAMNTHLSEYTSLEESFYNSQYSYLYTFQEAMYLFYGARNEDDMMYGYIQRTLEPMLVYEYMDENKSDIIDKMQTYISEYYDNFFSLDVSHILIYFDENNDGTPDDYETYYNELEDSVAYDALLVDFIDKIRTYLDENDDNLSDLVTVYKAAARDDELWGVYKQAGFRLLSENLSSSTSLNYMNSYLTYEDSFVTGLIDLYQTYQLAENVSKSFIYNDTLIESSYGLHLVKAEPGDNFDLDSAAFTVPQDTTYDYPQGLNNTEFRLSNSQIEVYFNFRVFEQISSLVDVEEAFDIQKPDIPDRIEDLLDLFVQELFDAYYSSAFLNMATIDILLEGTLVDQSSNYSFYTQTEFAAYLNMLYAVYDNQILVDFE